MLERLLVFLPFFGPIGFVFLDIPLIVVLSIRLFEVRKTLWPIRAGVVLIFVVIPWWIYRLPGNVMWWWLLWETLTFAIPVLAFAHLLKQRESKRIQRVGCGLFGIISGCAVIVWLSTVNLIVAYRFLPWCSR
jgi:hypothetical protein